MKKDLAIVDEDAEVKAVSEDTERSGYRGSVQHGQTRLVRIKVMSKSIVAGAYKVATCVQQKWVESK